MEISKSGRPFVAADFETDGKKHLLLCASGSVATIKIPDMLEFLAKHKQLSVRVILTKAALYFLKNPCEEKSPIRMLKCIPNVDEIFIDDDEWERPWSRGEKILHIELRRWADIMVIAPLSANTQAKIVAGLADNLLTSVVRAWDTESIAASTGEKKTIIVAPSMNTAMWKHPVTRKQLKILEHDWAIREVKALEDNYETCQGWFEVLRPVEKELACGDVGLGAMCEWRDIVAIIEMRLKL